MKKTVQEIRAENIRRCQKAGVPVGTEPAPPSPWAGQFIGYNEDGSRKYFNPYDNLDSYECEEDDGELQTRMMYDHRDFIEDNGLTGNPFEDEWFWEEE